jgi:hypothetical protein
MDASTPVIRMLRKVSDHHQLYLLKSITDVCLYSYFCTTVISIPNGTKSNYVVSCMLAVVYAMSSAACTV